MNTTYAQLSCVILDCFSHNYESAFEDSMNVDWTCFDIEEDGPITMKVTTMKVLQLLHLLLALPHFNNKKLTI